MKRKPLNKVRWNEHIFTRSTRTRPTEHDARRMHDTMNEIVINSMQNENVSIYSNLGEI